MNIPLPHAPHKKYGAVNDLCRQLVPNGRPIYLKVEPYGGTEVNECFPNVDLIISQKGGQVQYGWQIWEGLPGLMLEAEFHAVWVDPLGSYHDVTPRLINDIKKILFLPDPHRRYEGQQVMSVLVAIKNDQLIEDYIENRQLYFEATNRGELASQHINVVKTPEIQTLESQQLALMLAISQRYYF